MGGGVSGTLHIAVEGPIARLTFDNPGKHNAMTLAMWQALGDFCADPPAVRVVLLAGAGEKAFVSGADITEFALTRATPEQVAIYDAAVERAEAGLAALPMPTLAMIRGWCIGGGLGIAARCDMRIASDDARFAVTPARLGLGYAFHEVAGLHRVLGPALTADLLFTARQMDAAEAQRCGLVNRVTQPNTLAATATETASTIAANAPLTIRAIKAALVACDTTGAGTPEIAAMVQACYDSADYAEGRAAFAEKRQPHFQGR